MQFWNIFVHENTLLLFVCLFVCENSDFLNLLFMLSIFSSVRATLSQWVDEGGQRCFGVKSLLPCKLFTVKSLLPCKLYTVKSLLPSCTTSIYFFPSGTIWTTIYCKGTWIPCHGMLRSCKAAALFVPVAFYMEVKDVMVTCSLLTLTLA